MSVRHTHTDDCSCSRPRAAPTNAPCTQHTRTDPAVLLLAAASVYLSVFVFTGTTRTTPACAPSLPASINASSRCGSSTGWRFDRAQLVSSSSRQRPQAERPGVSLLLPPWSLSPASSAQGFSGSCCPDSSCCTTLVHARGGTPYLCPCCSGSVCVPLTGPSHHHQHQHQQLQPYLDVLAADSFLDCEQLF